MSYESPSHVLSSLIRQASRGAQAELARALAVRPQTVSKWITGQVSLPLERWLQVERFFGLEPLEIARRTGFLESMPEWLTVPPDRLDAAWEASFKRREHIPVQPTREPGAIELLTQAVEKLTDRVAALEAAGGGPPSRQSGRDVE